MASIVLTIIGGIGFTCGVFPFVIAGTKKRVFGFPPKKPKIKHNHNWKKSSSSPRHATRVCVPLFAKGFLSFAPLFSDS